MRLVLLGALALAVLGLPGLARAAPDFTDRAPGRLILTTPGYRLSLSKEHGSLLALLDQRSRDVVLRGAADGCLWRASGLASGDGATACTGAFSYRWDAPARTLHLTWSGGGADVAVDVVAGDSSFDLWATVRNRLDAPLSSFSLPADVVGPVGAVQAGYSPTYLPGLRLRPGFFARDGDGNVSVYPSRWAFADYAALDVAGGRVALYTVNPPPAPIAPARVGFLHDGQAPCAGDTFCVKHSFLTWTAPGATWSSPPVRVVLGASAQETILAYRRDNRIDAYPSLADKLGARLGQLARSPEVKADLLKGLPPFAGWGPELARLPSPALLHPVAFTAGGHDATDPDFLPPAPAFGGDDAFRAAIDAAHARSQLVMPYLNPTWWVPGSPTLNQVAASAVAARDPDGKPITEGFSGRLGLVVSPFAAPVRDRVARLMDEWRDRVPADCLFFDQLGARPWIRDLNPAAPGPLAYDDGWLALLAPYAGRCLMVEDGWDRLGQSFVGFHGSALLQQREFGEPDAWLGAGNWEAYPLADWLLHDKVLLYQHDLYDGTFTTDGPTLTWNLAFGFVLSGEWNDWTGSLSSPWLDLAGSFQRALGPHYVGKPLDAYRQVAQAVTESDFGGDLTVLANWGTAPRVVDGSGVAASGCLARSSDGAVLAGSFVDSFGGAPLAPGTHYLVVERGDGGTEVRQPVGGDTDLAVAWSGGASVRVQALAPDGSALGDVAATVSGGRVRFHYAASLDGRRVGSYRISST